MSLRIDLLVSATRERRFFFFEKKRQKTSGGFDFGAAGDAQPGPSKVFWCFFLKKERLSCRYFPSASSDRQRARRLLANSSSFGSSRAVGPAIVTM
jgi:hypothetical protein